MQSRQFLRFLLVGGLNAAFGYGVFALLTWLGLPYAAAIALATVLGIAFNYQSTGRLVFGGTGGGRAARFVCLYAAVYLINVGAVAGLLRLGLNVYLANALLLLPLALLSYVLQRKFVFAAP